jgi:CBS domain containing-hemolysin-like protein
VWGEPNGVRELFWNGSGKAGGVLGVGVIVAVALAVASGVFVLTGELVAKTVGVINASAGAHAERNIAIMLKPHRTRTARCRWDNMLGILL